MDPRDQGCGYFATMFVISAVLTVAAGFLFHLGWNLWTSFASINW